MEFFLKKLPLVNNMSALTVVALAAVFNGHLIISRPNGCEEAFICLRNDIQHECLWPQEWNRLTPNYLNNTHVYIVRNISNVIYGKARYIFFNREYRDSEWIHINKEEQDDVEDIFFWRNTVLRIICSVLSIMCSILTVCLLYICRKK